MTSTLLAGVDGCRGGWCAVFLREADDTRPALRFFERFADILACAEAPAIIAVDMPIGLPDRSSEGGRAPERAVRSLLGPRGRSVFSVPARAAVMCTDYRRACEVAYAHSDPKRRVSRQCFHIFAKIREIDGVMTPALEERVYETHPELCFWRLNGERPMSQPKKTKAGIEERMALLSRHGLARPFLDQKLPRNIARDDLLDACACALMARRIKAGRARAFPEYPARDEQKGLRMAIWA